MAATTTQTERYIAAFKRKLDHGPGSRHYDGVRGRSPFITSEI